MDGTRICDFCEEQTVGLFFKRYKDYENFQRYGTLPHGLTLLLREFSVQGGRVFHLWPIGISIVLCDKCLSGNQEMILQRLVEKPRIIREAIDGINRAIAEDEEALPEKEDELSLLKAEVYSKEIDIQNRKEYLIKQKEKREELAKKMAEIGAVRQQVVVLLQKIVNHS